MTSIGASDESRETTFQENEKINKIVRDKISRYYNKKGETHERKASKARVHGHGVGAAEGQGGRRDDLPAPVVRGHTRYAPQLGHARGYARGHERQGISL